VGTSAITLIVQKVKAPRLFGQQNWSKEKLNYSSCFPKRMYYWISSRPACTCGLRLYRRILTEYVRVLVPWTDPLVRLAVMLSLHWDLTTNSKFSLAFSIRYFPSPYPFSDNTQKGGAVMCRQAKWITQARLSYFHSSGKSELPLDRDLLCVVYT
jgi:hypothetical protein